MKFGESLSEGLVPEWKDQYVHYKLGKKRIKSIASLSDQLEPKKPTDTTPLLEPINEGSDPNFESINGQDDVCNKNDHGFGMVEVPAKNTGKFSGKSSNKGSARSSFLHFSGKSLNDAFLEERREFLRWLDDELKMVDEFYKEKEKDVYSRFLILEDQFFQLREHKMALAQISREAAEAERSKKMSEAVNVKLSRWSLSLQSVLRPLSRLDLPSLPSMTFLDKLGARNGHINDSKTNENTSNPDFDIHFRENQIRNGKTRTDCEQDLESVFSLESVRSLGEYEERPGSIARSKLTQDAQQPELMQKQVQHKDYVTKKRYDVPYLYARKQLKDALVEHYRSIALIRSYRTMNRTALRKITKKFDKVTGTTISEDFMKKIDKNSYFQQSETLDQVSTRVEDLFLTFYDTEKTDRKHGLEKLRSATYAYTNSDVRASSYYKSSFSSGLFLGIALPFLGISLYVALRQTLSGALPEGRFMLQLWGGFLLVALMMLLVGINFLAYDHFKINYKFIFEFNLANALNFRQFYLLPSFGFGLLCALAWISFSDFWPNKIPGRVWPLIYLAWILLVFLWPGSHIFPSSRRWMQVALWRIFCSGFYPVEFRDFFLGDILCSLTYSISNLSFFICLYADKWRHYLNGGTVPISSERCGSHYSRSMGFLSTLPFIWRFLQCLRRYMDTGDAFPHLANMAKYTVSIVYYVLLSIWRIDRTYSARAAFITVACVNSIFSSVWDIVMDWSLGSLSSKNYMLRDHLFYKKPLFYYVAILVDVLLRFSWIFYAFFSAQIQQSALTSFAIALAEIVRRFLWMFIRMENEHCANVIMFRASRDSPLPYMLSARVEKAIDKLVELRYIACEKLTNAIPSKDNADARVPDQPPVISSKTSSSRHDNGDEMSIGHSSVDLSRVRMRRRSTFFAISDALNKAHVKDFQRKKYAVQDNETEDEEDLDEETENEV